MAYIDVLIHDKNLILYRPELNKITGNPLATLMLCQIIYWSCKFEHKEFYKNIYKANSRARRNKQKSWQDELGFNRYQTEKSINILIRKNLIEVRKENSSHNTYVKLNIEFLEELLRTVYTIERKQKKPVVEGEQRELFPIVEGEQPSVVEGEQPPLSKVNNRTITETTQRLHKEAGSFLNKIFKTRKSDHVTEYKLKQLMKKLTIDQKEKVKRETDDYIRRFPELAKNEDFVNNIKNAYIKKQIAI